MLKLIAAYTTLMAYQGGVLVPFLSYIRGMSGILAQVRSILMWIVNTLGLEI